MVEVGKNCKISLMHCLRAILKNNWSEVVDLILKPRPGGKDRGRFSCICDAKIAS